MDQLAFKLSGQRVPDLAVTRFEQATRLALQVQQPTTERTADRHRAGCRRCCKRRVIGGGHRGRERHIAGHQLGRQVLGLDHLGRRHHGQPVADVLQLPHVAWKVEVHQPRQRRFSDSLGFHAQLLGALGEEEPCELGHVLAPLSQRRQAQSDHVEAVKQVLAKDPITHPLLEVLVRRRDHPDV